MVDLEGKDVDELAAELANSVPYSQREKLQLVLERAIALIETDDPFLYPDADPADCQPQQKTWRDRPPML